MSWIERTTKKKYEKLNVIKCKKNLKTFSTCVIISVQLEGGIDYER